MALELDVEVAAGRELLEVVPGDVRVEGEALRATSAALAPSVDDRTKR